MQIHSVVVVRCTVYECGDESPLDDSRTQQQTTLYQLLPLHIRILIISNQGAGTTRDGNTKIPAYVSKTLQVIVIALITCMMVDSSKLWGYLDRLWHVLHWRRDWNVDSYNLTGTFCGT